MVLPNVASYKILRESVRFGLVFDFGSVLGLEQTLEDMSWRI
jgi:hypothetical protein